MVTSGKEALAFLKGSRPQAVLLSLDLPDMDGLNLIRDIRGQMLTPIVVVSCGDDERALRSLDYGADDYVCRTPDWTEASELAALELVTRLRVTLRLASRAPDPDAGEIVVGELRLSLEGRTISREMETIALSPLEFTLLNILMRHPGRVFSHEELLHQVWGPNFTGERRYLRVYINRLRQKIERDPQAPVYLRTAPRHGYFFALPPKPSATGDRTEAGDDLDAPPN